MLSGTSRISFKTAPEFLNRSSSLVWSDALATCASSVTATNTVLLKQDIIFLICFPQSVLKSFVCDSCVVLASVLAIWFRQCSWLKASVFRHPPLSLHFVRLSKAQSASRNFAPESGLHLEIRRCHTC